MSLGDYVSGSPGWVRVTFPDIGFTQKMTLLSAAGRLTRSLPRNAA
jgi:hypothetical protein